MMYVFCTDVIREGNEVKGVVIESKAGREAILARTVIDARATPTWPSVPASSAAKAMPRAACSPRR